MNTFSSQIQYLIDIMPLLGQAVATIANILDCRFVGMTGIEFKDNRSTLNIKNALSRALQDCIPHNFPLNDEQKAKILNLQAFALDIYNCKDVKGFDHIRKSLIHPHLTYEKFYSLQLELHIGSSFIRKKRKIKFLDSLVSKTSPDIEVTVNNEKKYFECASITEGSKQITNETITEKIKEIIKEKNRKFTYENPGITVIDCSWVTALGKFDTNFINLLKKNLKSFINKGLYKKTESVVLAIRYFKFGTNHPTTSYLVINKEKSQWEKKFSFYEKFQNSEETILLTKLGI